MPSFLKPRSHRRKLDQERKELEAKQVREARALAALAEELGWGAPRRESDVGTLGGSTLVGSILVDSIEEYDSQETNTEQRPSVDQLTIEQVAAVRWRAHTPELPEREEVDSRPRSIRFANGT